MENEKDIEESPAARREYEAKFGSEVRVPAFDFDGETATGFDPAILRKWVAEMKAPEEAQDL